jgi:hypothetical protein
MSASPRVQTALALLRERHERVTRARQAVIEVLDGTMSISPPTRS